MTRLVASPSSGRIPLNAAYALLITNPYNNWPRHPKIVGDTSLLWRDTNVKPDMVHLWGTYSQPDSNSSGNHGLLGDENLLHYTWTVAQNPSRSSCGDDFRQCPMRWPPGSVPWLTHGGAHCATAWNSKVAELLVRLFPNWSRSCTSASTVSPAK